MADIPQVWDPVARQFVSAQITDGTPSRTPLIATITLTGTAVQLSTATGGTAHSHAGWRITVPPGGAGVLWGTQAQCVSPIPADATERAYDDIPSGTLAGWWAKSDGANVDIVLLGAVGA